MGLAQRAPERQAQQDRAMISIERRADMRLRQMTREGGPIAIFASGSLLALSRRKPTAPGGTA
jgi:hypothetical protein